MPRLIALIAHVRAERGNRGVTERVPGCPFALQAPSPAYRGSDALRQRHLTARAAVAHVDSAEPLETATSTRVALLPRAPQQIARARLEALLRAERARVSEHLRQVRGVVAIGRVAADIKMKRRVFNVDDTVVPGLSPEQRRRNRCILSAERRGEPCVKHIA